MKKAEPVFHLAKKIATPWGFFVIKTTAKGIYALDFPRTAEKPPVCAQEACRAQALKSARKQLGAAAEVLKKYFKGGPGNTDNLKFDLSGYTAFEKKILQALSGLRKDERLTYGGLAVRAGFPGAARAVGSVMRKNRIPILIPCHRIIASTGLGGYSQGLVWKRRLMKLEEDACPGAA